MHWHISGEVDKFTTLPSDVMFPQLSVYQKLLKSVHVWQSYCIKKTKRWQFFWGTQCMFWYRGVASKSRVAEKGAAELWLSSASKWCDDDDDDDDNEVEQLSVTRIIIGTQRVIQKRHSSDPVYVRQLRLKVGLWKASVHTTVTDLKISLECISIATTD